MILLRLLPQEIIVQYAMIYWYWRIFKTYYITVVDHAGFADDQDVTFTKIPVEDPKNHLIKLLISLKAKQFFKRCYL
jgi:hypothetical protein